MFERVNELALRVCSVAMKSRRQHLASLVYSYVPVENERQFEALRAQVGVLRTLLKLRPSYSEKLTAAVNDLIRETTIVGDSLRSA